MVIVVMCKFYITFSVFSGFRSTRSASKITELLAHLKNIFQYLVFSVLVDLQYSKITTQKLNCSMDFTILNFDKKDMKYFIIDFMCNASRKNKRLTF